LAYLGGASTRYGNRGFINMGTLGMRFGGVPRGAEVSAARWGEAIRAAKARGVRHLSKEKGLVVRLPISGDVVAYLVGEECVALGAWASEFHDPTTLDSSFAKPGKGTYDIPLRALMSRDTVNLFAAGRTADGDQIAGASLRVMGTAFATGQAAGIAAAHCAAD